MGRKIPNEYIFKGDYTILRIYSRKYGKFDFKIDNDDVEKCKMFHWCLNRYYGIAKGEYYYATNRDIGLLHRFVMNAPKGKVVDHISGDTLDNRKFMLQTCEHNENIMKAKKRVDNESGHVGVHQNRQNKWMAYINIEKKRKHLGYFDTYEEALECRLKAEEVYWSDFRPIDTIVDK